MNLQNCGDTMEPVVIHEFTLKSNDPAIKIVCRLDVAELVRLKLCYCRQNANIVVKGTWTVDIQIVGLRFCCLNFTIEEMP